MELWGYNPRQDNIVLEIYIYGNCLVNREYYNGGIVNIYEIFPVENFESTVDGESIKADTKKWIVRRKEVLLSHNKKDYKTAGIELKEYEPGEIRVEEAARLVIIKNSNLFRATDAELYKCIPSNLKKILVLNEWYQKDFYDLKADSLSEESMRTTYEDLRKLRPDSFMKYEEFRQINMEQMKRDQDENRKQWKENRPSSYETWQQIAKVIVTGNKSYYHPTLKPNSHWKNWPESGGM